MKYIRTELGLLVFLLYAVEEFLIDGHIFLETLYKEKSGSKKRNIHRDSNPRTLDNKAVTLANQDSVRAIN